MPVCSHALGARTGATYWRLNSELVAGTFDRVASLWFVASCLVLQPGNNACSIMYGQKPLLRRELSNGLYHYSSFFVAKSLTSLPFQAMFAALFNTAVYFLARAAPWPSAWLRKLPCVRWCAVRRRLSCRIAALPHASSSDAWCCHASKVASMCHGFRALWLLAWP